MHSPPKQKAPRERDLKYQTSAYDLIKLSINAMTKFYNSIFQAFTTNWLAAIATTLVLIIMLSFLLAIVTAIFSSFSFSISLSY
jgi:hypothetical protein